MLNQIVLIGRLGADPETRKANSGAEVHKMRIATDESFRKTTSGTPKPNGTTSCFSVKPANIWLPTPRRASLYQSSVRSLTANTKANTTRTSWPSAADA